MKIIPTFCCRLISKRISKIFKKYQNKKPTIVKEKIGFKLNLGIISFRLCRKESLVEFATQLNLGIFQFEWRKECHSLWRCRFDTCSPFFFILHLSSQTMWAHSLPFPLHIDMKDCPSNSRNSVRWIILYALT